MGAEQRGELVVEIEGYDPVTGGPVKRGFSYVASELFVDHEYCPVLELDEQTEEYKVNLERFHRTYAFIPGENYVYAGDHQGWVQHALGEFMILPYIDKYI